MSRLTDSHVHLSHYNPEDVPGVLDRARKAGVGTILTLGLDLEESRECVEFARSHEDVYAGVGVHPWRAEGKLSEEEMAAFRELASQGCVKVIGEAGLDQFGRGAVQGALNRGNAFPLDDQRVVLGQMIQLAREAKKPLMLHGRMTYRELLASVGQHGVGSPGDIQAVVHDFTGEEETAFGFLDEGFYLSVTGVITRPDTESLKGIVRKIPLDRILLETDSPARQPVAHLSERNEPAFVADVAQTLAEIYGVSEKEIAQRTEENLHEFLGLS
jgi:TatD DNase family protein